MTTSFNAPRTVQGIKHLATHIQKAESLSRMKALDVAAQQAGFVGFKQAQRHLDASLTSIEVTCRWHDTYGTKAFGIETLTYPFKKPLRDLLCKPKGPAGLGLFYINGENTLYGIESQTDQGQARLYVCQSMRKLMFMEATGLVPAGTDRKVKPWPVIKWRESGRKEQRTDRVPDADHASMWRLPGSNHALIVNEPYGIAKGSILEDKALWLEKHGFVERLAKWGGIYNPTGGTVMYLLTHKDSGFDLDDLCAKIDGLPDDFGPMQWPGVSRTAKNLYEPGVIIQ